MNQNKFCPECNKILSRLANRCRCGWQQQEEKIVEADFRCRYAEDLRCPLDGCINFSTHGGAPWYCGDHLRNLGDRKRCHEILMEAWEHFVEIMESRIDWKIRLFPEDYAARKRQIQILYQSLKK